MSEIAPEVVATLARATGAGLRMLSAKVLAVLALGMAFGLFVYAIGDHSWIAYVIASTFTVLVFLPCLWFSKENKHE